ncbi:MAG: glutamine synthetase adenylyltransferase [Planctomycetota bacterium]|nr:glutamine synthetase adenylyltransferase [Planctomycetota bacterium]
MFERSSLLLDPHTEDDPEIHRLLKSVGFSDIPAAQRRFQDLCTDEQSRTLLAGSMPPLLIALSETATPDGSLVNFERLVQTIPDRAQLFLYLSQNPRAVEILVKLFVGSQFLTEILLRNPSYLAKLTRHKRLAEFKSQQQFVEEAQQIAGEHYTLDAKFDALRRFQHWELLRIGACDSFGLMDLKSITVQLSLLTDSLVQSCLILLAQDMKLSVDGFAVLAFGKLGGEELNYSSDIDLVFLVEKDAAQYWKLGQQLIKALMESTMEGFMYRVDMRLRPWGRSGPLVNTVDAHVGYLRQHGMLWEKQALLKARVIAGEYAVGKGFLERIEPIIYSSPADQVRRNIREMKQNIEANLEKQGRKWGEVKSGEGSIRDIEFVVQFLQLRYGGENRAVRSINTLDALVRLVDFGYLKGDEYRILSSGYHFLRTIEHALQLMHYKQVHALPDDHRELSYLARRLDYPDAEQFLQYYRQHCRQIRAIFEKYIGTDEPLEQKPSRSTEDDSALPPPLLGIEPSYTLVFSPEEIRDHATLFERLSDANPMEVTIGKLDDGTWRMTTVGYDCAGKLSVICGHLFIYGCDIVDGHLFVLPTGNEYKDGAATPTASGRSLSGRGKFISAFTVKPPVDRQTDAVWMRLRDDLCDVMRMQQEGKRKEVQGILAKRAAEAVVDAVGLPESLLPVEVEIDNETSASHTLLRIRAEDTIGFLYELTNALAISGIHSVRVVIQSIGKRIDDTLWVTDHLGDKITDPKKQREVRTAIVLIKHFTHLLPRSPNPETALLQFQGFLEQLFDRDDWVADIASLENTQVLDALAQLLGVSNFLWEDFLRLQHDNLFPVVKDVDALKQRKPRSELESGLEHDLADAKSPEDKRKCLNAWKDREMFRTDMRHILELVDEFGEFSEELTDVAEATVDAAYRICNDELAARYGQPQLENGMPNRLCICALGKCGGRELGYASDIELMFVYDDSGKTAGPEIITAAEYYIKLVETFSQAIQSRSEGIFHIDLRLRPYGRAGSLAVAREAFEQYFRPDGPAWPYERQALVKLRPISGDLAFGQEIVDLRDRLVFTGEPFDVNSMRAMRERQLRQLVTAGTINAKLTEGGLVDCEYLVQGLQISYGHRDPALRETNTLKAMNALRATGILSEDNFEKLRDGYIFQRHLIDALRMVRGNAWDLTVPPPQSEEFLFLARRLGYQSKVDELQDDLQRHNEQIRDLGSLLDGTTR